MTAATAGSPPRDAVAQRLTVGGMALRVTVVTGALTAYVLSFLPSFSAAEVGLFWCPIKSVTTVPCPSCGLTRAWFAISSGNWFEALALNALSFLAYGFGLIVVAVFGYELITRRSVLRPFLYARRRWVYAILIGCVAFRYVVLLLVGGPLA